MHFEVPPKFRRETKPRSFPSRSGKILLALSVGEALPAPAASRQPQRYERARLPRWSSWQPLGLPTAGPQPPVNHRAALLSLQCKPRELEQHNSEEGQLYKRRVG